jgi:surface antigen
VNRPPARCGVALRGFRPGCTVTSRIVFHGGGFVLLVAGLLTGLLSNLGVITPAEPVTQVQPVRHPHRGLERRLCHGYTSCRSQGFSDAGYRRHRSASFWRMYTGSNCTNFVAYRLVQAGLPNERPMADAGRLARHLDAYRWGLVYASITDHHPTVDSVAWWSHRGRRGHVAWIETVNHDGSLTVSEDSASGNGFDWRRITRGAGWPTGFIHFPLRPVHRRRAPEVNHHSGTPLLMDLEAGGLVLNGELADPTSTAAPTTPDWQPR